MRALVHLAAGDAPDCTKCADGEAYVRREFGCDGPVAMHYDQPPRRAVLYVSCECGGRDPECTQCGRGNVPLYHCPRRLLDASPHGSGVMRAFRACQHYPLLPAGGGVAEQTDGFMEALSIYQAERHAIAEKERKAQEKAAKMRTRPRG